MNGPCRTLMGLSAHAPDGARRPPSRPRLEDLADADDLSLPELYGVMVLEYGKPAVRLTERCKIPAVVRVRRIFVARARELGHSWRAIATYLGRPRRDVIYIFNCGAKT